MFRKLILSLFATLVCTLAETASAIPLTLEYKVSIPFYVRYDFRLVLDNHDGTWSPGDGYNWFVIGDEPAGYSSPSGLASPIDNISFRNLPTNFFQSRTSGTHNGPTLFSTENNYIGWVPQAVGDSLEWFGLSPSFARDGEIYWSQLSLNGLTDSPWASERFLARQVPEFSPVPVPTSLPEPPTWALILLGCGALSAVARRR